MGASFTGSGVGSGAACTGTLFSGSGAGALTGSGALSGSGAACTGTLFSGGGGGAGASLTLSGAGAGAGLASAFFTRRFTTVGRMRSSTTFSLLCFSRWRFTRSTASGATALM